MNGRAAAPLVVLLALAGCGAAGATENERIHVGESYKDIASFCDGPNRVYTVKDKGGVAVAPNDPRCVQIAAVEPQLDSEP